MEATGIAFVVGTLLMGVAVLQLTRRRSVRGFAQQRRARAFGAFVDSGAQADVHLAAGRRGKARQILEDALRLNPERTELRERLDRIPL